MRMRHVMALVSASIALAQATQPAFEVKTRQRHVESVSEDMAQEDDVAQDGIFDFLKLSKPGGAGYAFSGRRKMIDRFMLALAAPLSIWAGYEAGKKQNTEKYEEWQADYKKYGVDKDGNPLVQPESATRTQATPQLQPQPQTQAPPLTQLQQPPPPLQAAGYTGNTQMLNNLQAYGPPQYNQGPPNYYQR